MSEDKDERDLQQPSELKVVEDYTSGSPCDPVPTIDDKCPKCGAELDAERTVTPERRRYECGTSNYGDHLGESMLCLRRQLEQARAENARLRKHIQTPRTDHDGDCTIYGSLHNGSLTDGICTCGYGRECVRKGDFSKMFSEERTKELGDLAAENARLKAALATPEVYAEIVTKAVEDAKDKAVDELLKMQDENAMLREFVDKLPKYADTGEPAIPGHSEIWLIGNHWISPDEFALEHPTKAKLLVSFEDHMSPRSYLVEIPGQEDAPEYWDGPFYSTYEAAEAAKEKGE